VTRIDELADPVDGPASLDVSDSEGATTSIYLPPFRIDVTVRPGIPYIASRNRVAGAVRAALEAAGAPGPASIGVVLSADTELAELNVVHMGSSGATDVLSFPFFPPEAFPQHDRGTDGQRDPWVAAALKQAFDLARIGVDVYAPESGVRRSPGHQLDVACYRHNEACARVSEDIADRQCPTLRTVL